MAGKTSATAKATTRNGQTVTRKKTATPAATSHVFSLMAPEATEVYVAGDFNNWETNTHKLRKYKNGLHKKSVRLKPGRYEYRFVVDSHWWTDPENQHRCTGAFGEDNSVVHIG